MARRPRPNPRRVKIHRSYTVEEAAACTGVHRNTVRAWIGSGLSVVDRRRPTLIHGLDLRHFLEARRRKGKAPLAAGEIYCVRCRAPKSPAGAMADYLPLAPAAGNLRGICPDCDLLIHRRVSLAKLEAVRGNLEIAFPHDPPRIGDSPDPCENRDSSHEGENHDA